MIVFELVCTGHHRFEGWFSSAGDFESQKSRGLLSCPVCSDAGIEKLLTAKIGKGEPAPVPAAAPADRKQPPAKAVPSPAVVQQFIEYVLMNTEDVGRKFAEEARRIHNEETQHRNIRGVATAEEARELLEEGIPVLPLPVPPTTEWN